MSDLPLRLGRAIRRSRRQRGWTQEALAGMAGINRGYLGEIERGLVSPSLTTADRIATALQLRLSNLLDLCEEV